MCSAQSAPPQAEQKRACLHIAVTIDSRVLGTGMDVAQVPLQRRGIKDRGCAAQRITAIDDTYAGASDPDRGLLQIGQHFFVGE